MADVMDDDLLDLLAQVSDEELSAVLAGLPVTVIEALLESTARASTAVRLPEDPLAQALEIDEGYRPRAHLRYLAQRLRAATEDVEQGRSRYLLVSMPPRSGKSQLASTWFPLWLIRRHPDWKIGLISHTDTLAISWGRTVRALIEEHEKEFGIRLAKDAGAASNWQTEARGSLTARSTGQSITGLGFKVMIVDDAVKDFAAAHSATQRDNLWDWWTGNAVTRLEAPSLVVIIGTRWHEDDLIGRLLSPDYPGDPSVWEVISFPALAEGEDVLGRAPGEPLLSPLVDETPEEAMVRWGEIREAVGSYSWAALYQQRPAPAEGAIFDTSWWCYWTTDPSKVTEDGRVVYLDPSTLTGARWLDSWDFSFEGTETSDFVVGQRWARQGPNRYLIAQHRARLSFTQTLAVMRRWASSTPYCDRVHERLVEAKANGVAVIDTLREELSGIKPIKPTASKEARARIVTPEIESGHVYLPHPQDPGNEWVLDLLSELRNFPNDAHDDQVDTLTQALWALRDVAAGGLSVPGRQGRPVGQRALTTRRTIPRRV